MSVQMRLLRDSWVHNWFARTWNVVNVHSHGVSDTMREEC